MILRIPWLVPVLSREEKKKEGEGSVGGVPVAIPGIIEAHS